MTKSKTLKKLREDTREAKRLMIRHAREQRRYDALAKKCVEFVGLLAKTKCEFAVGCEKVKVALYGIRPCAPCNARRLLKMKPQHKERETPAAAFGGDQP